MIVVLLTLAAVIIIMAYMFYRFADTDITDKRHVVTVSFTYDVPTADGAGFQNVIASASIELPIESPLHPLCDTMATESKRLSFTASAKERQKIREFILEAASIAAPMWQEQHDALQKELVETLLKNISGNSRSKPENHADDNI